MKHKIRQGVAAKTRSESKNVAGKAQMPEVLRGSLTMENKNCICKYMNLTR
jgi:hypothetical protein